MNGEGRNSRNHTFGSWEQLDLSTFGPHRALSAHFAVPIFDFFRCLGVPWALQPAVTPRPEWVRQKTGYVGVSTHRELLISLVFLRQKAGRTTRLALRGSRGTFRKNPENLKKFPPQFTCQIIQTKKIIFFRKDFQKKNYTKNILSLKSSNLQS